MFNREIIELKNSNRVIVVNEDLFIPHWINHKLLSIGNSLISENKRIKVIEVINQ